MQTLCVTLRSYANIYFLKPAAAHLDSKPIFTPPVTLLVFSVMLFLFSFPFPVSEMISTHSHSPLHYT